MLQKIDAYFIDLGEIVWGIILSGLVVIFMLLPGLIFAILLLDVLNIFMGESPYIFDGVATILKLLLLSFLSWYLGRGLGKFNSKTK